MKTQIHSLTEMHLQKNRCFKEPCCVTFHYISLFLNDDVLKRIVCMKNMDAKRRTRGAALLCGAVSLSRGLSTTNEEDEAATFRFDSGLQNESFASITLASGAARILLRRADGASRLLQRGHFRSVLGELVWALSFVSRLGPARSGSVRPPAHTAVSLPEATSEQRRCPRNVTGLRVVLIMSTAGLHVFRVLSTCCPCDVFTLSTCCPHVLSVWSPCGPQVVPVDTALWCVCVSLLGVNGSGLTRDCDVRT